MALCGTEEGAKSGFGHTDCVCQEVQFIVGVVGLFIALQSLFVILSHNTKLVSQRGEYKYTSGCYL